MIYTNRPAFSNEIGNRDSLILLKSLAFLMLPPSALNLVRSDSSVTDVRRVTGPLLDGARAMSAVEMLHQRQH